MDGTKLTPNAVEPGAFQEHIEGMIAARRRADDAADHARQEN